MQGMLCVVPFVHDEQHFSVCIVVHFASEDDCGGHVVEVRDEQITIAASRAAVVDDCDIELGAQVRRYQLATFALAARFAMFAFSLFGRALTNASAPARTTCGFCCILRAGSADGRRRAGPAPPVR